MNYLEIFGTFIGIIYLWLEYRASIYLWLAGIIMPAIYIFVYYDAGLYADFGINIYYLIAAIYGWFFWMWGHRKKKSQLTTDGQTTEKPKDLPIVHTPCLSSALPGYLSNTQTVTFRGWTASQQR